MNEKLLQILALCLNGRKIAVWGTPTRSLIRALRGYDYVVARDGSDTEGRYVVAVTEDDLDDFQSDEACVGLRDVDDYICYTDVGRELPFEWTLCGASIGRQTYFGEGVADACENGYIASIGKYTSINGSAMIHGDHHRNAVFISDELEDFFDDENRKFYHEHIAKDAKHPYMLGKPKLTIGNDVWIGAMSFIDCSKVSTVGDGAIIAAGAVVTKDVPPYAIVAGVPAVIKGYRFPPELVDTLERERWWDWDTERINREADALLDPEVFLARYGEGK